MQQILIHSPNKLPTSSLSASLTQTQKLFVFSIENEKRRKVLINKFREIASFQCAKIGTKLFALKHDANKNAIEGAKIYVECLPAILENHFQVFVSTSSSQFILLIVLSCC